LLGHWYALALAAHAAPLWGLSFDRDRRAPFKPQMSWDKRREFDALRAALQSIAKFRSGIRIANRNYE
jgi:hypothetical protein